MKRIAKQAVCSPAVNLPRRCAAPIEWVEEKARNAVDSRLLSTEEAFQTPSGTLVLFGFPGTNTQQQLLYHAMYHAIAVIYVCPYDGLELYRFYARNILGDDAPRFYLAFSYLGSPLLSNRVRIY